MLEEREADWRRRRPVEEEEAVSIVVNM